MVWEQELMECHQEEKLEKAGDLAARVVHAGCWEWAAVTAGGVQGLFHSLDR